MFPFPGPATFVTAENPSGRALGEEENQARRCALLAWLDAAGLVWHPAVGGDPNGEHLEPGAVVLGLDLTSAAELGARFDQAAVYLWARDALHLLSCTDDRHDVLGYRAAPGTRLAMPA